MKRDAHADGLRAARKRADELLGQFDWSFGRCPPHDQLQNAITWAIHDAEKRGQRRERHLAREARGRRRAGR